MEQQACNVWRKRAFSAMMSAHDQFGKDAQGADRLLGCLDTFRERVDHNVENSVPAGLVRKTLYAARVARVEINEACVTIVQRGGREDEVLFKTRPK